MLAALALRHHHREPSGHVHPEEALLSLRHRRPRRFDIAAMAVGAATTWSSASLATAALLSAAMSSCAAWSRRCVSNDARIALCFAAASFASVSVGSWAAAVEVGAVVVVARRNRLEGACRRL
jgi:hypothetical protein